MSTVGSGSIIPRLTVLVIATGCYDPADNTATDASGSSTGATAMDSSGATASSSDPSESSGGGSNPTVSTTDDPTSGPATESAESSADSSGESSTGAPAMCGNGIAEDGEACDLGMPTPECSGTCTACDPPPPMSALDQQLSVCEGGAFSDCRDGWSMANGQSGLQALRVSQAGMLDSIELYVANEAIATTVHTVQLVDGGNVPLFPVGASVAMLEAAVVATATAAGTADFNWTVFDFADAEVQLDPDRHYFVWLRMLPPFPADQALRLRWNLFASPEVPDPYAGGRSFFCPAGATCDTQLMHWDFAFRLRLFPNPPLCE